MNITKNKSPIVATVVFVDLFPPICPTQLGAIDFSFDKIGFKCFVF
jgi:hypothetical protein